MSYAASAGLYSPADVRTLLAFDHGDIVLALQIEPELCAVAEIPTETHGGVGGDRAPPVENIGDAPRWHAEIERQTVWR
jgi:hypothetical protein